jgi:hypothetical protein
MRSWKIPCSTADTVSWLDSSVLSPVPANRRTAVSIATSAASDAAPSFAAIGQCAGDQRLRGAGRSIPALAIPALAAVVFAETSIRDVAIAAPSTLLIASGA